MRSHRVAAEMPSILRGESMASSLCGSGAHVAVALQKRESAQSAFSGRMKIAHQFTGGMQRLRGEVRETDG